MHSNRFRYTSHTADMAFTAYGRTFSAALENSALALLNAMLDLGGIKKASGAVRTRAISDRGRSREDIVWFVLQDILSIVDSEKMNAYKFSVTGLQEKGGHICVRGLLSYKRIEGDFAMLSVKAVTPHGLRVEKRDGRYAISVVVDV